MECRCRCTLLALCALVCLGKGWGWGGGGWGWQAFSSWGMRTAGYSCCPASLSQVQRQTEPKCTDVAGIWILPQMFCTCLRAHDELIQRSYVWDRCVKCDPFTGCLFSCLVLIHIYNPGKGVISWLQKHKIKRFWKSKDAGIRPYLSQQPLKDHKPNWPWGAQCYQQAAISRGRVHYLLERSARLANSFMRELGVECNDGQSVKHVYIIS